MITFRAHPDNQDPLPHLMIFNSIISAKSLLPHKVIYALVLGIRMWASLGTVIQPTILTYTYIQVLLGYLPHDIMHNTMSYVCKSHVIICNIIYVNICTT